MMDVVKKIFLGTFVLLPLLLLGCGEKPAKQESGPSQEQTLPDSQEPPENSLLIAKARYVVGDVRWQHPQKKWNLLQVGNRIVEKDKIRTELESAANLSLTDGSVLKVVEKTEVCFMVDSTGERKKLMIVTIEKGRVHFDIQKQQAREFRFKTKTGAAAIRATAGFVGEFNGKMIASLKEGKVDVINNAGKTNSIIKDQTVVVDEQGKAKILDLASSGTETLSKTLDSVMVEQPEMAASVESIERSLKTFDASYVTALKAFESRLQFRATAVGDTLFVPSVTLTARATPGILVTVWGQTDSVGANGIYQHTFTWGDSAYGTKRFLATCGDGFVETPCYMWVADYVALSQESAEAVSDTSAKADSAESLNSAAGAKEVKLSVKVDGPRDERIHLDLPATELNTKLKFSLSGISVDDLSQITSVAVLRNGKPFKTFGAGDLTSLNYEVPLTIARNKIADFEVVATLKNGKKIRAKKTFEVYCLVTNHPGGKARNSILPQDQEYERLKQSGGLTHE